jgi:hypothetical protein
MNPTTQKNESMNGAKTMTKRKHIQTYLIKRKFLETLEGYIEASRCKTLDSFCKVKT